MKRILKFRHWQIFSLLIAAPILIIVLGGIVSKFTSNSMPMGVFPLLASLVMMICYFGYVWTLGIVLPKSMKQNFKDGTFKLFFRTSLTLFILTIIITFFQLDQSASLIANLRLIAFLCFLYCIYLITERLKSIELNRRIYASSQLADFFSIWILPFGIWIIQPRVNNLEILGQRPDNLL